VAMRRRKRGRSSSPKADWVYRPLIGSPPGDAWGAWAGSLTQSVPRNDPILGTVNSGHAWLYDSENFLQVPTQDWAALQEMLPKAARAEGRRPKVLQVEGQCHFRIGAWSTGNTTMWGVRLGWYEQDTQTGLPSIEPEYSMFEPQIVTGGLVQDVASYANDRLKNIREWTFVKAFGDSGSIPIAHLTINVKFPRGRTAPSANHGLMLYYECSGLVTPVNGGINVWTQVRSLISDDT